MTHRLLYDILIPTSSVQAMRFLDAYSFYVMPRWYLGTQLPLESDEVTTSRRTSAQLLPELAFLILTSQLLRNNYPNSILLPGRASC